MFRKGKKQTNAASNGAPKKSRRKGCLIVVLVILVIGIAGAVAGGGTSGGTNSSSESPSQEEKSTSQDAKANTDDSEQSVATSEQEASSAFDPSATTYEGLAVEVTEPKAGPYSAIVSIYGTSGNDFAVMRQFIIDAAAYYGLAEDANTIGTEFDSIIGSEGGSGSTWTDGGIITSAPNDTENTFRADLYVTKQ
jgi:hypothetical protein